MNRVTLHLPAGMAVRVEPAGAQGYPLDGGKCRVVLERTDRGHFDQEDRELLCVYFLTALDLVSKVEDDKPPQPVLVSEEESPENKSRVARAVASVAGLFGADAQAAATAGAMLAAGASIGESVEAALECDYCKQPKAAPVHSRDKSPLTWHPFRSAEQRREDLKALAREAVDDVTDEAGLDRRAREAAGEDKS